MELHTLHSSMTISYFFMSKRMRMKGRKDMGQKLDQVRLDAFCR